MSAKIGREWIFLMNTGLVSVTFRNLTPFEIIELTAKAGLDGIEWGGDIHCPPGDVSKAEEVFNMMTQRQLKCLSYGSYYKARNGEDFLSILAVATALHAPNIRIWVGEKGSLETDIATRKEIVSNIQQAADMALEKGISISFEYHANTLTDTIESTLLLLDEVSRPNVYTYWQPHLGSDIESNLHDIRLLSDIGKLKNLHVYHELGGEWLPLADGRSAWEAYLAAATAEAAILEFVRGGVPEQFMRDAEVLRSIVCNA